MKTDWKAIDFSRVEVVSYDAGHTLYFPNYQIIAEHATEILQTNIPAHVLMRLDWEEKTQYSAVNIDTKRPHYFHFGYFVIHLIKKALAEMGRTSNETDLEKLINFLSKYQTDRNYFHVLTPDALRALILLKQHGIPMIVISNAHGNIERDMHKFGTDQFFEHILDSGIEGVAKPNKEIFVRAADRCGVKIENMLHIGDNPTADVRGAISAGMQAALYDPTCQYPLVHGFAVQFCNHVELVERLLQAHH